MDLSQIATEVVKEQVKIIGPLAIELAKDIDGLDISDISHIKILEDPSSVLHELVLIYSRFFGKASVEVCKEVIRRSASTLPAEDLAKLLADISV